MREQVFSPSQSRQRRLCPPPRRPQPRHAGSIRRGLTPTVLAVLLLLIAPSALAEPQSEGEPPSPSAAALTTVPVGYLKQEVKQPLHLSRLNVEPEDLGVAGAEIALKDNNTTGRFTKQQFTLDVEKVPVGGDAAGSLQKLTDSQRKTRAERIPDGSNPALCGGQ